MTRADLVAHIRERKLRRPLVRRLSRPVHVDPIAVGYLRDLFPLLADQRAAVEHHVRPHLASWVDETGRRYDDTSTPTVHEATERAAAEVAKKWTARRFTKVVQPVAEQIRHASRAHAQKLMRTALGIDVLGAEPNLEPQVARWAAENVRLIKSIPAQHFAQLEEQLVDGIHSGARWETLAKGLEEREGITKNRAALIARTETAKLDSKLNSQRMSDLGIAKGIWRGTGTNTECPICDGREGEEFPIDDGIDGELPGYAHPACNCWTEPVLDDLFAEAAEAA